MDGFLIRQLASSEIEARSDLVSILLSNLRRDDRSSCPDCRRYQAFQLAFHYHVGLGVVRDTVMSERWLLESNETMEDLQNIIVKARTWNVDEPLYRPSPVQDLIEEGVIESKNTDFRWSYGPRSKGWN